MNSNSILTFVPPQDEHAWGDLSAPAKHRAELLYEVARAVQAAPFGTKGDIFKQYAEELGYKHVNGLSIPVNKFLKTKNWWHLVDRRRDSNAWCKTKTTQLPHAFVEHWKTLVENNQRCASAAYDVLMKDLRAWRAGDTNSAIPGYLTPPPNAPGHNHPAKWSLRDLRRKGPSEIELAAARSGRSEALKHAPSVLTTRKGGHVGMELQFDDMFHDIECRYGDSLRRPLEYSAQDFYSNFYLPPGIKPRIEVDGKYKDLTELEFALYAVNIFCSIGYSPRGTLAMAENAKAVFRDGLAKKLNRWSGGLITTTAGAMSGAPVIAGGYAERAKGSANAKALKEGFGKIYHNRLADLPGQLGMNPENLPAYTTGMRKETADLILAQSKLSTQLEMTHLPFDQIVQIIYSRLHEINCRTTHNIEGWLEENLVTTEYLADPYNDTWINISTLPAEQQAAFQIIAQHSSHNFRPRRLSPYEVWTPASANFLKLSPIAEADCLYEYARRTIAVKAGYFEFSDKDLGIGVFRYRAQYQDQLGMKQYLPNDAGFHLVINPFNPERAFIFTEKGQYLGMTPRHHEAMRTDADAIRREQGAKKSHLNAALTAFTVRNGLKNSRAMTENARKLVDSIRADLNPQTHQTISPSAEQESLYDDCDLPEVPQASDDIDVSRLLL